MTTQPIKVVAADVEGATWLTEPSSVPVFSWRSTPALPIGTALVRTDANGRMTAEVTLHERSYELLPIELFATGRLSPDERHLEVISLNARVKSSMREGVEPT